MSPLTLGVLARTRKENEQRLPIHPLHLDRLDRGVAKRVFLETGYGSDFGVSDEDLARHVGGVRSRADLIAECDVILLLKPDPADLAELRDGQVLWGWPHCVQDRELTQQAIDRKLTLLAFEAMNLWRSDGSFKLHVFHKNNELAGYASVQHALQLIGSTGMYGRRLRAVVLGFGSTGRGAVTGLNALGVNEIQILTNRPVNEVSSPIHSAEMLQFDGEAGMVQTDDGTVPLAGFLAEADVVVNCVLQDPNAPLVFLNDDDLAAFRPGSLIVDVSCDEGMGFSWARPTTFTDPTFTVGDNITYYAVDHSPSYLWNAATWEISEALLPYLSDALDGPDAWEKDPTLKRAIEIQDGRILNPDILAFQNRSPEYPHASS
ncbi:N(5)-(carboxyethyl)ornithine synthase [Mycolicibacterium arenosum]|uniref:N(5)-(Carboxyethyl)ornithine synthase n=1 Tax=Mycolicibacterium arenosum TaxID=2952157 RepID=A0ABT1M4L1_9MYCO|nr:N(5)-(carboxyethyl)ornithine synthase [Mycolicibacterium sp. CAU 1645]MCP9274103.1 N(5)-(carboxyethyl)ornithine synthase [Mycolicibacterium sp. CAU 1645]